MASSTGTTISNFRMNLEGKAEHDAKNNSRGEIDKPKLLMVKPLLLVTTHRNPPRSSHHDVRSPLSSTLAAAVEAAGAGSGDEHGGGDDEPKADQIRLPSGAVVVTVAAGVMVKGKSK
ncbi:hypothetical protein Fmac_010571 [Flemingia macrophylla]|uniref:Uncharacterized protein n=1 Tax=Flemingia macrophylla TaxID=520843 RepID=A0ABD1MM41_9FABA